MRVHIDFSERLDYKVTPDKEGIYNISPELYEECVEILIEYEAMQSTLKELRISRYTDVIPESIKS